MRRLGIRMINGKEYMICGRTSCEESARKKADSLKDDWDKIRVIKLAALDFGVYVHGAK